MPAFEERWKLFTMHFFFSAVSNMWNMGISLFVASFSNNSLFLIALVGLVSNLIIILFLPSIGVWLDKNDRLISVQTALAIKFISVSLGFIVCAILTDSTDIDQYGFYMLSLPLLCGAANLSFTIITMCIEKDWVVVLSGKEPEWLASTNSVMSQIDLGCQSAAPAVTAFLFALVSPNTVAIILLSLNCLSTLLLLVFLRFLYFSWSELKFRNGAEASSSSGTKKAEEKLGFIESFNFYLSSGCVGVTTAYSFLYLTVLSFGNIMTVYLVCAGMSDYWVGISRGVSSFIGFIGASIYPYCRENFGLWNSGTGAIWMQLTFVGIAAFSFFLPENLSSYSSSILVVCVLISRVGLWLFDLCVRQIAQETIPEEIRGKVNGSWQSITSFFTLSSYAVTMVFSQTDQFWLLSLISFCMVLSAALLFTYSSITRSATGKSCDSHAPLRQDNELSPILDFEKEKQKEEQYTS